MAQPNPGRKKSACSSLKLLDGGDFGAALADDSLDAAFERRVGHRAAAARADHLDVSDALRDAHEPNVAAIAPDRGPYLVERGFQPNFQGRSVDHACMTAGGAANVAATAPRGPRCGAAA